MAVYFIQAVDGGPIKIGKALDVHTRLSQHRRDTGKDLVVLGILDGYTELEKELHGQFSGFRVHGEWFEPAQPILDLITTQTIPFDRVQSRSNHLGYTKPPTSVIGFTDKDSLIEDARKMAGWVPLSEVIRRLLKMWVNGEIKLDLSSPDKE